MQNTEHIEQGTDAWRSLRKDKVGGSDAGIIMGVSPWTTPYELWTYKMGLAEPEMNAAMQRGVAMEEEARQAFNSEMQCVVKPRVLAEDDVYPWMMASLDGFSDDGQYLVEIKCAGQKDHDLAKTGEVPAKYFPQLQHQLYMTGLKKMWYYSYRSAGDTIAIPVLREDEYIKDMIEKEKEFYRRMIEFDPPPLCDKDYIQRDDEYWESFAVDYKKARNKRIESEKEEEYYRNLLITCSGGKNCQGAGIRLTKYARKGAVQYAKIPVLQTINLEQYRALPVESYRITEVQHGDTA